MKKIFEFALSIVFVAVMALSANALDLTKMKAAAAGVAPKSTAPAASADELAQDGNQADKVKNDYLMATQCFLDSIVLAQDAFGLKQEAEITKAEAAQLATGTLSKQDIEKHTATLENAQRVIEAKINQGGSLDKAGKDKLKQSMGLMTKGIVTDATLTTEVVLVTKNIKDSLAANPLGSARAMKSMLPVMSMMSKELPRNISTSKGILGLYIGYAKSNGIDVPKDATALFN